MELNSPKKARELEWGQIATNALFLIFSEMSNWIIGEF